MQIAIIGAGRMGSTFAFHLARAGHHVTVVARGRRLETLQREGGIESVQGERATFNVASSLDTQVAWDGVLVMVLAHQVDALLPTLKASAAKSIVFMFNNVEPLERLRRAVGPDRCEFGFPTGFALLIDDKLRSSFTAPGQAVYVSNANWARVFREAKIPSIVEPDMESSLRTHAAFAIPLMASGVVVYDRGAGITWSEARRYARALREGIALVRRFGSKVTPRSVAFMAQLPGPLLTALLWGLNRTQIQREFGSMEPGEVSQLIDAMERLAPGNAPTMLAIRPSVEPLERPRSSAARSGEVALR